MSQKSEVHVVLGCADARDVGAIFASALASTSARYAERGVHVHFHALRTAGSFVTRDVIEDVRRIVELQERIAKFDVRYFVHIQTHGEIRRTEGTGQPLEHLEVVQPSPFNCGMLGAAGVSLELERLILRTQPTLTVRGVQRKIASEADIRMLLADVYGYRGAMAGDWIRSIDDLRTHPRLQATVLASAIADDRTLRNVDLVITAGIQDYGQSAYFRVDDRADERTFWDDVYDELRKQTAALPPEHGEIVQRTARQAPKLGLFTTCDFANARSAASEVLASVLGNEREAFGPNQVFTFASDSFDLPHTPFGPYTVAGFYYAVAHLRLRDFVVLGHDEHQARRILARLDHDPLVRLIAKSFDVRYHAAHLGAYHGQH